MNFLLSLVITGVGVLFLIFVHPYKKDRGLCDWAKAMSASIGGGLLVFGGMIGAYSQLPTKQELLYYGWQCVGLGVVLVILSGVVRFKRESP